MSDNRLFIVNEKKREYLCVATSLAGFIRFINKDLFLSVLGQKGIWRGYSMEFYSEDTLPISVCSEFKDLNTDTRCYSWNPDYKTRLFLTEIFRKNETSQYLQAQ